MWSSYTRLQSWMTIAIEACMRMRVWRLLIYCCLVMYLFITANRISVLLSILSTALQIIIYNAVPETWSRDRCTINEVHYYNEVWFSTSFQASAISLCQKSTKCCWAYIEQLVTRVYKKSLNKHWIIGIIPISLKYLQQLRCSVILSPLYWITFDIKQIFLIIRFIRRVQ